jgi:cellulose synthase/poly-beta-1,6-N-acetylglucosamine synthase-like glycosyltransferase
MARRSGYDPSDVGSFSRDGREDASVKIAVVVPVRNGAAMVTGCVAACLAQTLPPEELIVVDNGSTDQTAVVAARAGATVISEPQRGSYRARNLGWRSTTSEIVAFTDVDCLPDPTWLRELVQPFADPSVVAVGGAIVQHELTSASQRWIVERRFLDQDFNASGSFMPFFATANVAYRRSILDALNGFDEIFLSGGDNDFSWRLQALTDGRLVYRAEARVRHQVGRSIREVTSRCRRYAVGDYLLEKRWSMWPGYPEPAGFLRRTSRIWLLPAALGKRLLTRRPLSIALIDAATAISIEMGRRQGRNQASASPVEPLQNVEPPRHVHRT